MSATETTAEEWDATQRQLRNSDQWKYATEALTGIERIVNRWSAGELTPTEALLLLSQESKARSLHMNPKHEAWLRDRTGK
jgi:hypothetical protein